MEFSFLTVGQLVMGAWLKRSLSSSLLQKNRRVSALQLSLLIGRDNPLHKAVVSKPVRERDQDSPMIQKQTSFPAQDNLGFDSYTTLDW